MSLYFKSEDGLPLSWALSQVSLRSLVLWVLWTWAQWCFRARCFWGSSLRFKFLKSWDAWCGVQTLCSSEKALGFELHFASGSPYQGRRPNIKMVFLVCLLYCAQPALRFYPEETVTQVVTDSAYLGEGWLRISLCCHLEPHFSLPFKFCCSRRLLISGISLSFKSKML